GVAMIPRRKVPAARRLFTELSTESCNEIRFRDRPAVQLAPPPPKPRQLRAFARSPENILFSLIQAAGWPVWFLIVASIAAVALIIERSLSLKRSKVLPTGLLEEVLGLRRAQPVTPELLNKLAANSPLGRVLA